MEETGWERDSIVARNPAAKSQSPLKLLGDYAMPIYEYRCRNCGQKSSFFTRSIKDPLDPVCSHCASMDMQRTISSFAYHKSLKTIHEQYGPTPGIGASSLDYYSDPRNVGRHIEESFEKHGVDIPQSVRDTIDSARDGELPKGLDL
jgi:putative FmdB family regulatory protein